MSALELAERGVAGEGKRRRRSWTMEERQRILAESYEPGASVSVVARRHDLNANMLFTWRREARAASSKATEGAVTFVPATITAEPEAPISPAPIEQRGRMEIALAGGERVIVGSDVDATALARVIKVLSRR